MAKNIDFMGATFPDVPSIRLPQHEGGLVSFDDTSDGDIVPSDVAQGKIGYAQGQRVVGTAVAPSGSQIFTENGTFDVTSLAEAVINVAGGGGASNVVSGEFTGTADGVLNISVPYSGSGYPIALLIFPTSGPIGDVAFNQLLQRSALQCVSMIKTYVNTTPAYESSVNDNAIRHSRYKSSTSNASSYSGSTELKYMFDTNGAASGSYAVFKNSFTLSVLIVSSGTGFPKNIPYTYHIIYST